MGADGEAMSGRRVGGSAAARRDVTKVVGQRVPLSRWKWRHDGDDCWRTRGTVHGEFLAAWMRPS